MNMEFLYPNYINTSTMISVDSSTATASYLFYRKRDWQYTSSGFGDDLTTTSITITFPATQPVDRIVLENINFKDFTIFYNGVTANTLAVTSTSETTTSDWTSNSSTALYLAIAPVNMTSLTIDILSTMIADKEKQIGQLWVSEKSFRFDRNPSLRDFKPSIRAKEINLKMSDGGITQFHISDKKRVVLNLEYREGAEKDGLRAIYDRDDSHVFAPFPTGTSWAGDIAEYNWTGGYDFLKPSNNYGVTGDTGKLELQETPS